MSGFDHRAYALLLSRTILALIFLMAGIHKVFVMGAVEHARKLFVEPYSQTFLPVWSLWFTGTVIPYVELLSGGLLLIGFRRHWAYMALGGILVIVTFGHLLAEPFYEFHTHVIPRLALLIFNLLLPLSDDRWSLDEFLKARK